MEVHIRKVTKFIEKYSPNEVSLETAKSFLDNDYLTHQVEQFAKGSIDDRYISMAKSGIKISGKMLMVSFIPRVVEIVKYTAFRKVTKITVATRRDKDFLRNYWYEHYFFDLPDEWTHVIHISFIQRKKKKYVEAIYSFPSCVIDKFYTLLTNNPIHEIFSQVFTPNEFHNKYQSLSSFIDLKHMKQLPTDEIETNHLQNPAIVTITGEEMKENKYYDPDNEYSTPYYYPQSYFYYSSLEKSFISISYYEYEFLILTHLIGFINTYFNLPQSISIQTSRSLKSGIYVTIKIDGRLISNPFIEFDNNYDIGNPIEFFMNAKDQPTLNIQYIPMIYPTEDAFMQYAPKTMPKCFRCTKSIEKGAILVAVKDNDEIVKIYHLGCVDLTYVLNIINVDKLKVPDKELVLSGYFENELD